MTWLSYLFPQFVRRFSTRYNRDIQVVEINGAYVLLVNGIQQSGPYTTRLWDRGLSDMLRPKDRSAIQSILIFGVGGGTAFHMLHSAYPNAVITGVDIDGEILALGKEYFGLDHPHITLVCADARAFVGQAIHTRKSFDLVIIDLYIGNDVPSFAQEKKFLQDVKVLIKPHGTMIMNYFSFYDQKHTSQILLDKLSKIYQSVHRRDILHNKFFYCSV